jgi:hypothetical protein
MACGHWRPLRGPRGPGAPPPPPPAHHTHGEQAKAEQDAYLAQLEAEGELEAVYGQGVQLVQPQPAFVIKTKTADAAKRVYINVGTSCKVCVRVCACGEGGGGVRAPPCRPPVVPVVAGLQDMPQRARWRAQPVQSGPLFATHTHVHISGRQDDAGRAYEA